MAGDDGTKPVGRGGYVVAAGDGMSSIAEAHGFFWKSLWDHPDNADLRTARKNAEILMPGDRVTVPPIETKAVSVPTGNVHTFRRRGVPAKLRMTVADRDGTPFAGKRYTIEADSATFEGKTDPAGKIDHWVPPATKQAKLTVWLDTPGFPPTHIWMVEIGGIDPIETVGGVQARLTNLGFPCDAEQGSLGPITQGALRSFQREHGLPVTGQPDDATRRKIADVYGV